VESKSSWTWTPPWCGRPSSSLTPWPSPSPCWSSPLFLINKTCMEPSVSSEKQLIRLQRTWRSHCCARALVIGPCIVCKGEMSSSGGASGSNQNANLLQPSLHGDNEVQAPEVHEHAWGPSSRVVGHPQPGEINEMCKRPLPGAPTVGVSDRRLVNLCLRVWLRWCARETQGFGSDGVQGRHKGLY
jgi:hypothetical protein